MRLTRVLVKKTFFFQNLYWSFTVWINCSSDLILNWKFLAFSLEFQMFFSITILETKYHEFDYGDFLVNILVQSVKKKYRFLWKLDDTIQKRSQWSWEFYRLRCKSTLLYFWTLSTNTCNTELLKWRLQGFFLIEVGKWYIHTYLICTSFVFESPIHMYYVYVYVIALAM